MHLKKLLLALFLLFTSGPALAGQNEPVDKSFPQDKFVGAIKRGADAKELAEMLRHGADARKPDHKGLTPLMAAAFWSEPAAVRLLLESGADANARAPITVSVMTKPLAFSPANGDEVLLSGTTTDELHLHSWTPLMCAALAGKAPAARLLLEHGADVNAKGPDGETALMLAIGLKAPSIFASLLARERNGNAELPERGTASGDAAPAGAPEIITLLLDHGAEVNGKGPDGVTALMLAATFTESPARAQMLLDHGADVNAQDSEGVTALMIAIDRDAPETFKLLLGKADVNAQDAEGRTALMIAASHAKPEYVRLLLDKGADARAQTIQGTTALIYAASTGNAETVRLLLERKAAVNAKVYKGLTPLMAAASAGNAEVVRMLLEKGADVNMRGYGGYTALMIAAANGFPETTELLLKRGADRHSKLANGQTVLELARQAKQNSEAIVRLLESKT